jgi:hypothetical protein
MLGLSFLELGVYNFTKLGRNTGTEFGGGNFRKITRTSTNMQLHTYICTYMLGWLAGWLAGWLVGWLAGGGGGGGHPLPLTPIGFCGV